MWDGGRDDNKTRTKNVLDNLNSAIDDLAKIMREKITNNEIEEYKSLKVVYDKLKGTV